MNQVREQYEALRDENERLARVAEREMLNPELTPEQRQDAGDRAKVYWQLSRSAADTVTNAADVHPKQFRRKNLGPQGKTQRRIAYLREKFSQDQYHEEIAAEAMADSEAQELWGKKDEALRTAVLNFIARKQPFAAKA